MSENQQRMDMTPGIVSWNELVTNDPAGSREFYTKLFGWSIEEMAMPEGTYCFLKLGERPVGGMLQMPPEAEGAPTMWMPYVTVANLKDAVAKAIGGAAVSLDPLAENYLENLRKMVSELESALSVQKR